MARIPARIPACFRTIGVPTLATDSRPRFGFGLRAKSSMTRPKFSAGSDEEALEEAMAGMLSTSGGRWAMTATGEGLERTFKFKTFARTWDFMTAVALQCKLKNHHPEWSNVFNTTFIRWTSHHPKGLSAQDINMAALCDSLAKDFGEVDDASTSTSTGEMQTLTDNVVSSAGDCCTPKKA